VRRGEVVEAVHLVHVASTEGVLYGEDVVSHLRSAAKPIQAIPLADAYDDLDDDELAIACASHQAEPAQLDAVRKLLARAGATIDDLECGPQEGRPEGKLGHNCSGKHAGFLAVCRDNGWSFEGYRLAEHSMQQRIRELLGGARMPARSTVAAFRRTRCR
jgi:L-asparaginase II